jgi:hypothetical protein
VRNGTLQRLRIEHIHDDWLHACGCERFCFVGRSSRADHLPPVLQQQRDESSADCACGAGKKHLAVIWVAHFVHQTARAAVL